MAASSTRRIQGPDRRMSLRPSGLSCGRRYVVHGRRGQQARRRGHCLPRAAWWQEGKIAAVSGVAPVERHPARRVPGRRSAVLSLLMIPVLAIAFVAAYLLGSALQEALGLEQDELLWSAGALGALAAVLVTALLVSPQIAGIALGVKARRLGERRLGAAAAILNALIAAYVLLTTLLNAIVS